MKKTVISFFIAIIIPILVTAQPNNKFKFNKEYYDCEDRWVTTPSLNNSDTFSLGFIYLDLQAGYTLHYYGTFRLINETTAQLNPVDFSASIKVRLEDEKATFVMIKNNAGLDTTVNIFKNNNKKFAIIDDAIIKSLKLSQVPDWLKYYKDSTNSITTMTMRGSHLNHVGRSDLAVPVLENAYALAPDSSAIQFELSFAYNATEQYTKALQVLEKATTKDTMNVLLYKELAYSLTQFKRFSETEQVCLKIINITYNNDVKSETILNLIAVYLYFDIDKAKYWFVKFKQYAKDNEKFKYIIDQLEERLAN